MRATTGLLILLVSLVAPTAMARADSALIAAAAKGDSKEVGALIERGAKLDEVDADGYTALMRATLCEDVRRGIWVMRRLLAAGAEPSIATRTGDTALMMAVTRGSFGAADTLIAYGADPKQSNSEGLTPLRLAQQEGQSKIFELLKEDARTKMLEGKWCSEIRRNASQKIAEDNKKDGIAAGDELMSRQIIVFRGKAKLLQWELKARKPGGQWRDISAPPLIAAARFDVQSVDATVEGSKVTIDSVLSDGSGRENEQWIRAGDKLVAQKDGRTFKKCN